MLKMSDEPDDRCPFVGDEGCTVYEDRPWACRMYPLGMAMPPARAGDEPEPVYFLFEDDFCKGARASRRQWTVAEWRQDQGVVEHGRSSRPASARSSPTPGSSAAAQLDPKRMEMFYTACYDLDSFREFVFESTFLERFELEAELVEAISRPTTRRCFASPSAGFVSPSSPSRP